MKTTNSPTNKTQRRHLGQLTLECYRRLRIDYLTVAKLIDSSIPWLDYTEGSAGHISGNKNDVLNPQAWFWYARSAAR